MNSAEYRAALATLGLSQLAAGRWLGVSPKTAQRYATDGPSPPAARAIGLALRLRGLERWYHDRDGDGMDSVAADDPYADDLGDYVRHADVADALGLPS